MHHEAHGHHGDIWLMEVGLSDEDIWESGSPGILLFNVQKQLALSNWPIARRGV